MSSSATFWGDFDQDEFSSKLRTKLDKELSEGFASLVEHLQPKERVRQNLHSLERKASSALKTQLDILKEMCRQLVFQEPSDAPKRLPTGFKGTEAELDREMERMMEKLGKMSGEILSLDMRLATFDQATETLSTNLKRVRPAADLMDLKNMVETTRDSKRLKYLIQCTRELREKLPAVEDPATTIETLIAKERKGMASTRELQALDKLLSKSALGQPK